MNQKCKDDKSANSFPSGHVGEVLSVGLSYIVTKEYTIGLIVIFFTILISLATLFLRYHYFCDILMAWFLALLSVIINYWFGYRKYFKNKCNEVDVIINNYPESRKDMVLSEEVDSKEKV